ncbi:hypothetical protein C8Q79DRAFT_889026, partial [Trametes meyenii]
AVNVVVFGQPVDRLYTVLPPPRKDIQDCLAILFVGAAKPSDEDIKCTPFLVRRDVVARVIACALLWLQRNNDLYSDIQISETNLASYDDGHSPVGIVYRPHGNPTPPESLAVYEALSDRSVREGDISFVVHALHAPDLSRMTYEAKVALAVRHFESGNGVLAYGHESQPQSIYHNTELFPRMFPWLFPYGVGGFENKGISTRLHRADHIRTLLSYPDRRFQTDR